MLYTYSIEKLTGLQGIIINNIESNEKRSIFILNWKENPISVLIVVV